MFSTDGQLELLRSAHVIYIVATFRVAPSLYHQLFTISIPHADYALHVCFALITRKTTALYDAVKELLFQPTQVIAYFEDAPATAVRNVFGKNVVVSGRWFHYGSGSHQAPTETGLHRRLLTRRRNTDRVQNFRCLLSLPLLPAGDILPAFQEIKTPITDQSSSTADTNQRFRYFERQWLNKASIGTSRTNNSLHGEFSCRVAPTH